MRNLQYVQKIRNADSYDKTTEGLLDIILKDMLVVNLAQRKRIDQICSGLKSLHRDLIKEKQNSEKTSPKQHDAVITQNGGPHALAPEVADHNNAVTTRSASAPARDSDAGKIKAPLPDVREGTPPATHQDTNGLVPLSPDLQDHAAHSSNDKHNTQSSSHTPAINGGSFLEAKQCGAQATVGQRVSEDHSTSQPDAKLEQTDQNHNMAQKKFFARWFRVKPRRPAWKNKLTNLARGLIGFSKIRRRAE